MSEILRLKKDEVLFEKGDESEEMYILRAGKVIVFDGDQEKEKIKSIAMIGEMSFIEKTPRKYSVKAEASSTLVVINREVYQDIFSEMPEWYMAMYDSIYKRLKQMGVGDYI